MKKELFRSPNRKFCGVCAGAADYLNLDPTIIRIAVALIALYTAVIPALIIYFVVALIIPDAPENYNQLFVNTSIPLTKGHSKKLFGVCSGIAERFSCDVMIIRVLFVLCFFFFGTGLLAYLVCGIIMPEPIAPQNQQNPGYNPDNQPPFNN